MAVSPDVIGERVRAEAARLLGDGGWEAALSGAQPGPPLLVRHPDDGRGYYIVPLQSQDGRQTARMLFDEETGTLGQISGVSSSDAFLPPFLTPAEVPRHLHGREFTFGSHRLVIEASTLRIGPELVWRSCDQSHSMFQPFYEVTFDGIKAYLRVDGRLFPELTDHGAGA